MVIKKNPERILIVDDDERICNYLTRYLEREGYITSAAADGAEMRRSIEQDMPDLVILDLVLPGEDGLELARELRNYPNIGIIMLTGKVETLDRIVGLETGADDYLGKPFEKRELLARIHSVLRRLKSHSVISKTAPKTVAHFMDWSFDLEAYELVSPEGEMIHLTSYEYRLLGVLVNSSNRVLKRDQILDLIADREWNPDDRSIDVLVAKLRKKLEPNAKNPVFIKTLRGIGYKFTPLVSFEYVNELS